MLVYGDAGRLIDPRSELRACRQHLMALCALPSGLARHAALSSLFIDVSELAQGLADARFKADGCDAASDEVSAATRLLMLIAARLHYSWRHQFLELEPSQHDAWICEIEAAFQQLETCALPCEIQCKRGEGYAFYAVYPEAFLEAAATLSVNRLRVIGIRSIGLGLATLVATVTHARAPLSVRPVGHPFQRKINLSRELTTALITEAADYAIVDEGPGLSGSSFGTVLDHLEESGVSRDRLHVFPSHAGDLGPMATDAHRARWHCLDRRVTSFEDLILTNPAPELRLETWVSDLIGPATEPLQDLSSGRWRELRFSSRAAWPAVDAQQEKRKYLLTTKTGRWLLKFAGLGRYGESKLPRASALNEAGFTMPVKALRYGFMLEPWHEHHGVLLADLAREKIVLHLARYIAFRAARFPELPDSGASVEELCSMLEHNATEGLGADLGAEFKRYRIHAASLQSKMRRIHTDNRLQKWEWLVGDTGKPMKADALDHASAHDLIGCQDITWDIAGATFEFCLSQDEVEVILWHVDKATEHKPLEEMLRFSLCSYLAFQLGSVSMAYESAHVEEECARLKREVERYRDGLRSILQHMF